MLNYNKYAVIY